MSVDLDPGDALKSIPGIDLHDSRIEAMGGGLTNRVYKISANGDDYVLRLDANHTGSFGLDRATELVILRSASDRNLATEIVHADAGKGILLLRYVDGRVWTPGDLLDRDNLESLADFLRRVHAMPLCGKRFDAAVIADVYFENVLAEVTFLESAIRCKAIIRDVGAAGSLCCCHNDVVASNVIATPGLMLLDWEYACDNDPLFDLASLIAFHSLNDVSARTLLGAYAGGTTAELIERLAAQIRLYDALYFLWLASRQIIEPNELYASRLEELRLKLA